MRRTRDQGAEWRHQQARAAEEQAASSGIFAGASDCHDIELEARKLLGTEVALQRGSARFLVQTPERRTVTSPGSGLTLLPGPGPGRATALAGLGEKIPREHVLFDQGGPGVGEDRLSCARFNPIAQLGEHVLERSQPLDVRTWSIEVV